MNAIDALDAGGPVGGHVAAPGLASIVPMPMRVRLTWKDENDD